ncbi:MAG: hypothetical protein NC116_10130 [Clostridium sp.]|nr:hypothetical protein [Bacteroidales bacterium]MCM1511056.1 hypothetical protein [Clostridium sp.]
MGNLVLIIIAVIICVQVYFFWTNLQRMKQYSNIFSEKDSWGFRKDSMSGFISDIYGKGNNIFKDIVSSINKYLGNNSGSVIDFGLLKDAVDRHCESVENDITTQTPIPLYCGLAGTMAGVIIGLFDLLHSDAILTLMGSGAGQIDQSAAAAAGGIDALLQGVAWAMVASICGIILTTANSVLFKEYKLKEEEGKNSFLSWMQAELLPELPSDTSQALNQMVKNLNNFNNTFSQNTSNLGSALKTVNESYKIQADVIKAVHDMDFMKMAKANVKVLEELQKCTDKLAWFNNYLSEIEGYTAAIHRFETLFNQQADRVHVLEEIRDFFNRHKSEIAETTADADRELKMALTNIRDSTYSNVNSLHQSFVEQSETFKQILKEEKEEFEKFTDDLKVQFSEQMRQMPQTAKQLDEIAKIPSRLNTLIEKMEKSNSNLAEEVSRALAALTATRGNVTTTDSDGKTVIVPSRGDMPLWMQITGWAALVIMAIVLLLNFLYNIYYIFYVE